MPKEVCLLWLDMLGYKNWLRRLNDLERAEHVLVAAIANALKHVYGTDSEATKLYGIESLLVSDTIMLWTDKLNAATFTALTILYEVLLDELAPLGLPLRGAIAKGQLRVRKGEPRTILGDAIVKCAELEPQIDAFVVAVDKSAEDFLVDCEDDYINKVMAIGTLKHMDIETKSGPKQLLVVKWNTSTGSHALMKAYKLHVDRYRAGPPNGSLELKIFCRKLRNTREMINTIDKKDGLL